MRNVSLLITQARRATENVEVTDSAGISDEEFLQYANDAQDQIQSVVSTDFPDVFQDEELIDAVIGQEEYNIPEFAILGNRVDMVEYSETGQNNDYHRLPKTSHLERFSGTSSYPMMYIRRSNKILLQPQPSNNGVIRVLYQKQAPRIDKRRAKVSAVTLTSNSITSLTLDTTVEIDDSALLEEGYVSVVNKDGEIKMIKIPVTAIDTTTGIVTVEAGFTFEAGETIEVGNYLLRGKRSTTHSELPVICERYLIAYMNWKILKRDSSNDSDEAGQELGALLQDIVAAFKQPDGDVNLVPILDGQFLTPDDFGL
jgi:hypothetical protein